MFVFVGCVGGLIVWICYLFAFVGYIVFVWSCSWFHSLLVTGYFRLAF